MSGEASSLGSAALRGALRLAGELRDLPAGSQERREHMIRGLADLVGARVGLWIRADRDLRNGLVLREAIDVGFEPRERAAFLGYMSGGQSHSQDPAVMRLVERANVPLLTCTRADLVADRDWYRSPHVQDLRRFLDVDACIYTARVAPGGAFHGMAFHRAWGERPFSERERDLIDAFHAECGWVHEAAPTSGLAPRLRETLEGLLRGASEKEIAAALGLSPHTVHDYVKALHKRFGAASRGELLARFIGRAGG